MKILLVDDESIVLRGISTIIKKSGRDWEIVAECLSGEEALSAIDFYCPDVVISDIRMYGVSGIELAEKIREKHSDTLVILLTGYAEFSYAQQAVKLNVFDYLLKPTPYKDILECLSRAEAYIKEKRHKKLQEAALSTQLSENKAVLREKFLHDLMKGLLPVSVDVPEKIKEYQIDFSRFIILNLCHVSAKKPPGNDCRDKSLLDCSLDIFREIFSEVQNMVVITESLQNFAAVLETVPIKDDWKEKVREMATTVSDMLREKLGVKCHIGISETRNDAEEMFDCYNQSVYALETAKMKDEPVLFFEDLDYSLPKNTYSKTIREALDYIDRNFQDDISLKDVAEAVYLNVWYLSDLFRREVGKTFSEYVKHKRIELAKKLLKESSLKLYEVAYHIGIREQSYFSSLFKKETGMTPKQYREHIEL